MHILGNTKVHYTIGILLYLCGSLFVRLNLADYTKLLLRMLHEFVKNKI